MDDEDTREDGRVRYSAKLKKKLSRISTSQKKDDNYDKRHNERLGFHSRVKKKFFFYFPPTPPSVSPQCVRVSIFGRDA